MTYVKVLNRIFNGSFKYDGFKNLSDDKKYRDIGGNLY